MVRRVLFLCVHFWSAHDQYRMEQDGTKKYFKVPRSTLMYPEIPRSTQKNIKVSKSTSNYPEVHQKYPNVSIRTKKYLRSPQ